MRDVRHDPELNAEMITALRAFCACDGPRAHVARCLTPEAESGEDRSVALAAELQTDASTESGQLCWIASQDWQPAQLTLLTGVLTDVAEVTTAAARFVAHPNTAETRLVICVAQSLLAQLLVAAPFVNAADSLTDLLARYTERSCLMERFVQLEQAQDQTDQPLYFVVMKVLR